MFKTILIPLIAATFVIGHFAYANPDDPLNIVNPPLNSGGNAATTAQTQANTQPPVAPSPSVSAMDPGVCPVPGTAESQDKEAMYGQMKPGSFAGYGDSIGGYGILFVKSNDPGNTEQLNSLNAQNQKKFGQDDYENFQAFMGQFKINYKGGAYQCRRQIILLGQNSGIWYGHTAVEICNPGVQTLMKMAGSQNRAGDINTFLQWAKEQHDNGEKHPRDNSRDLVDKDTLSSLEKLRMYSSHGTFVDYFRDQNGQILPRFHVEITSLQFANKQNTSGNAECVLDVVHGVSYQVDKTYKFHTAFPAELNENEITWYFDSAGQEKSYNPASK